MMKFLAILQFYFFTKIIIFVHLISNKIKRSSSQPRPIHPHFLTLTLQMIQQQIKRLLKKYDMQFKQRKFIQTELTNRKIHKRSIRNKICTQGQKVNKLYCLLSGSVEISYTLSHQIKPKHFQNDEEKQTIHKMPKTQHFKLTFLVMENQLQFINEQALLQFIEKEEKQRQLANQRQHMNRSRQSSKSSHKRKKQDHIKSKYTATITSSECEYIEVSFQQAKMLLESRLDQIRKRDLQRQRLIKEKKRSFRLQLQNNEKKFMLDKISMPNLHNKLKLNLSPKYKDVQSLANLETKVMTTRYDFRSNSGKKQDEAQVNKAEALPEPIKKVRSISNMLSSKSSNNLQNNPFENNFGSSQFLSTQNNLILQKYRQRQGFGNLPMNPNNSRSNPLLLPKKGTQDKIFKQNLKKIIRKKLKFQRMHGQIIRENVHGAQDIVIQISNEYEYPIESYEAESQQLLNYHQTQSLVPRLSSLNKKPQTSRVLPAFSNNTSKHSTSVNKQQFLQKISSEHTLRTARAPLTKNLLKNQFQRQSRELNDLKKMRKKMEQHAIFMKLQDLDSYFNKI